MIKEKHYFTLYDRKDDDGDGTDIEETRYPYYDDNLNLVGYTSKLTESETGKFFAFVDFNADDDEGRIRECPHCDDERFLSCYEYTLGIHETHSESKIKDSIETTSNPFENESIFLSTETRKEQRRKGKKRKSKLSYKQEHEDPEIQAEIRKGNTVNILYDSSH